MNAPFDPNDLRISTSIKLLLASSVPANLLTTIWATAVSIALVDRANA